MLVAPDVVEVRETCVGDAPWARIVLHTAILGFGARGRVCGAMGAVNQI
jgi:hypothetical protein